MLLNSLLSYSQNHEIISTHYEKVGSTQVHFFWIWVHTFVGYLQTHLGFERENTEILHAFKVHCKDTAGASSIRLLTSQFLFLKETQFVFVFLIVTSASFCLIWVFLPENVNLLLFLYSQQYPSNLVRMPIVPH